MKNKARMIGSAIVAVTVAGISAQAQIQSSTNAVVMVSYDQTDRNDVGSVTIDDAANLTAASDIIARERSGDTQTNRQILTYVNFDLSGLDSAYVNQAGYQAILTLDYLEQLNTLNNMEVRVAPVHSFTNAVWSNTAGSYPLATWVSPADSAGQDLGSYGIQVLANVKTVNPGDAINEVVLDITDIVKDWVNGTTVNNGLVFFGTTDSSQAAGFTFTSLESKLYGSEVNFTGAVDSDWSNAGNWDSGSYPKSTEVAVLNDTADLAASAPNDVLAVRIGTAGTGTLNLQSGSALLATMDSTYPSEIGAGSGNTGTVNLSGGTHEIDYLEIGIGGTGLLDISGGRLTLSGNSDNASIYLGSGAGGAGTVEISGGALGTAGGIYLGLADGSGAGTFSVQGAGATEIGIGSEGDIDGAWYQNPGSTLRVGVSTNGVASILIADAAAAGTPSAIFAPGAVLDVAFIDGASEAGSWPVMVCEGTMTDFGLVFDPSMGSTTNDWGFRIIDNTLYVGYGLGWSAGGEVVSGQSDLIDATFNGIDDGLNESFSLLQNVLVGGTYSWSNETGEAAVSASNFQAYAVGCVSDTSINGAAYNGLTASFEINEIIHADAGPSYNGHFVGLSGNRFQLFNNAQLEAAPDGWAVGVQFLGGTVTFMYDNTNGNEVVIGTLGTYTVDSLKDGYTAKMVLDTNGWSVAVNGIETTVGGSGVWPAGFDFSTIQDDPDVFASMSYQGNITNAVVDVTSIKVSGVIGGGDNDGDDIPNSYEAANGLKPDDPSDRDTDLDGDGMSNYEEYVAGTAANDPDSVLKVTRVQSLADSSFVITWQSVAGKSYSVISNLNLVVGTEGVDASGIIGLGGETSHTTTVSGASSVFYKIGVE
ncbi:hypothetical protein [Pontiella sp.]|uniref:hypothetical protein n=1 Tax=Pontiella sp. TaxID=2837462 RepID=UPI0035628A2B